MSGGSRRKVPRDFLRCTMRFTRPEKSTIDVSCSNASLASLGSGRLARGGGAPQRGRGWGGVIGTRRACKAREPGVSGQHRLRSTRRRVASASGAGTGGEKGQGADGQLETDPESHVNSGENGMPQEGHRLECPDDKLREVIKPRSSGDTISLTDTQLPAEDIPDVPATYLMCE
jgi:hypothetical protein